MGFFLSLLQKLNFYPVNVWHCDIILCPVFKDGIYIITIIFTPIRLNVSFFPKIKRWNSVLDIPRYYAHLFEFVSSMRTRVFGSGSGFWVGEEGKAKWGGVAEGTVATRRCVMRSEADWCDSPLCVCKRNCATWRCVRGGAKLRR